MIARAVGGQVEPSGSPLMEAPPTPPSWTRAGHAVRTGEAEHLAPLALRLWRGEFLTRGWMAVPPGLVWTVTARALGRPGVLRMEDEAGAVLEEMCRRTDLGEALEEVRRSSQEEEALSRLLPSLLLTPTASASGPLPPSSALLPWLWGEEPPDPAGVEAWERSWRAFREAWIVDLRGKMAAPGQFTSPSFRRGRPFFREDPLQRALAELERRAVEKGIWPDRDLFLETGRAEEAAHRPPALEALEERVRAAREALLQRRARQHGGGYHGLRFNAGLESVQEWLPRNFALPRAVLVHAAQERRLAAWQRPEQDWPQVDLAVELLAVTDSEENEEVRRAVGVESLAFLQDLARHFRFPPPLKVEVRLRFVDPAQGSSGEAPSLGFRFPSLLLPEPSPSLLPAALSLFAGGPFPGAYLRSPPRWAFRSVSKGEVVFGVEMDTRPSRLSLTETVRRGMRWKAKETSGGALSRMVVVLRGEGTGARDLQMGVLGLGLGREGNDLLLQGGWKGQAWRLHLHTEEGVESVASPLSGAALRRICLMAMARRLVRWQEVGMEWAEEWV